MPWYKINIDGKIHIGEYGHIDNAVFGAMRRKEMWPELGVADNVLIGVEKLPPKPHRISKAAYTRRLRKEYS